MTTTKLSVMYGGSGAIEVTLPTGNTFRAQMRRNRRPHQTAQDVELNIQDAVTDALLNGQNSRVLGGGSVHETSFTAEQVAAMERAVQKGNKE